MTSYSYFSRFIFLCFFLISAFLHGQGYVLNYQANNQTTYGNKVVKVSDGGYLMATRAENNEFSYTFPTFIKTDQDGTTLSTNLLADYKIINIIDFITLQNGHYLCLATAVAIEPYTSFLAVEVDNSGEYISHFFITDATPQTIIKMEQANDGSLFILGTSNAGSPDAEHYVRKFTSAGTPLWRVIIGGGENTQAADLLYTSGGKLLAITYSVDDNPLISIDPADGSILSSQSMYTGDNINFNGKDLFEAANGDLVCLGGLYPPGAGTDKVLGLLRMDANGTFQWFNTFVDNYIQKALQVLENPDGSFILFYSRTPFTFPWHYSIKKVSSDGVQEFWAKELIYAGQNKIYIQIIHDGSGAYVMTGTNYELENNAAFLNFIDSDGNNFSNLISGNVFHDIDADCEHQNETTGLPGWIVSFESEAGTYYTITDESGDYLIDLGLGAYSFNAIPQSEIWDTCISQNLQLTDFFNQLSRDIPVQTLIECPDLEVNISTQRIRGCQQAYYNVEYCNYGSITANAHVEIELDAAFTFVSSNLPPDNQDGLVLTFDLGEVGVYECGSFVIVVDVSCDIELGQTHCVSAHIYPDTPCLESPDWSGAHVEVKAICEDDETVKLTIKNTGDASMVAPRNSFVIEDDMILLQTPFELNPDESLELTYPANGKTYRIEAEQEPNHPGLSMPSAAIEGCGGFGSMGYITWFSLDDADDFIDIDCQENVGSYDPNDKTVSPKGYRSDHLITRNTPLTYKVRFQNTGTDTAYLVVVRDTLSEWLDIASFKTAASSHPYELTFENITGATVLVFTFEHINLLPKEVDEPASQGFFTYKINQKKDLPPGTVINNSAAIYFDNNPAVITNTTFNTIGEEFVEIITAIDIPKNNAINMMVYPNPFTNEALFELADKNIRQATLLVYNLQGEMVFKGIFHDAKLYLYRGQLATGIYSFTVTGDGVSQSGKLVIH